MRCDAAGTREGSVAVSNGFGEGSKNMRRIECATGGIGSNGIPLVEMVQWAMVVVVMILVL